MTKPENNFRISCPDFTVSENVFCEIYTGFRMTECGRIVVCFQIVSKMRLHYGYAEYRGLKGF